MDAPLRPFLPEKIPRFSHNVFIQFHLFHYQFHLFHSLCLLSSATRKFEGVICPFFTPVLTLWCSSHLEALSVTSDYPQYSDCRCHCHWQSCMEASYCTFRFGTIIRHNLCALTLPVDSPHDNHYTHMSQSTWKRNSRFLWGLSYEKS